MFYQEIIEVFIDKITKNRQFFFLYIQVRYKSYVSIRSTPYCISQKNIVPLHGGIIFLILRQKNAI